MTAVKQFHDQEAITRDLRLNSGRKGKTLPLKVFEESEIDRESYGSSLEDMETYSPKSVVLRMRKSPEAVKNIINIDVFRRRVRNQIDRIRAEDSHLGEDIGECLIVKICGAGHDDEDVLIFSRSASPLSGKVSPRISTNP